MPNEDILTELLAGGEPTQRILFQAIVSSLSRVEVGVGQIKDDLSRHIGLTETRMREIAYHQKTQDDKIAAIEKMLDENREGFWKRSPVIVSWIALIITAVDLIWQAVRHSAGG